MNKIFAILLAGLVAPASAQSLESLRGPELNGVAPAQIPVVTVRMSEPTLLKLDLCVLTEMKNNTCHYTCQSGAAITRPAQRPDFSTGEPAGPCEPYITQQIKVTGKVSKELTYGEVEDMLRDRDPEVRKAAVRSARDFMNHSGVQDRTLELFKNRSERADIRVEAARSLHYAAHNSRVQEAFKDLLRYGGQQPRELRVMTYKALWFAAVTNFSVQDFLLDAIKYNEKDPAARKAAIWALFDASGNSVTQEALLDLAKARLEDDTVRVEAIKSLYSAVPNWNVKDELTDMAKDRAERKPVRLAAIRALSAVSMDSSVKSLLQDFIRYEQDSEVRVAAVWAASPDFAEVREYFHLAYRLNNNPYGPLVNPIEAE